MTSAPGCGTTARVTSRRYSDAIGSRRHANVETCRKALIGADENRHFFIAGPNLLVFDGRLSADLHEQRAKIAVLGVDQDCHAPSHAVVRHTDGRRACPLHDDIKETAVGLDGFGRSAPLHRCLAGDWSPRLLRRAWRRHQSGRLFTEQYGDADTVYRHRKSFDSDDKVKTLESTGLLQPESDNAYWRIRFFGIFKAEYLILEVAEDRDGSSIERAYRPIKARMPVVLDIGRDEDMAGPSDDEFARDEADVA